MTAITIIIARSSLTLLNGLAETVKCLRLRAKLAFPLLLSLWPLLFMITNKQKKFLRASAHQLKPVVSAGNAGISEGVMREIDIALSHHELIKVRISGTERGDLKPMAASICENMDASLVQIIGHIVVIYRPAKNPKIQLP